ncbi:hypothetical protein [Methanolapillus ohkumae]|uniref:DUF5640 domain-containing protein n=1 Tax=Methanolapillus ohkumae TaxID=3028298 RepID=A0AA96VH29_9EURY|nr:hypothetical protein MsAm2_01780 [Methanosarcinaceae archaeon Am2]
MIKKILPVFALFVLLVGVTAAGCMGDKVVGTWDGQKTKAIATFSDDKTYTISAGLVEFSGTWSKDGSEYILYSNDTKIGTAIFVNKDLRITIGSGILSITDDFVKRS